MISAMIYFTKRSWPKFTLRGLLLLVACAAVAALFVRDRQQAELRSRAFAHMREIALALRTLEGTAGEFPRAVIPVTTGRPSHSWRLQLAPLIDYSEADYDYREAWNSPRNQLLGQQRNLVYCWDESPHAGQEHSTNVLGIVGPGAAFDPQRSEPLTLRADLADLICAIEVRNSDIPWMQPRDLDYRNLLASDPGRVPQLGASDESFCVIFLDGKVWRLRTDTPRDRLVQLMTIDGAIENDRDALLEHFHTSP
ncbi:MAG: hypothetical protein SGJ19_27580 [Planctomycetia bacterium]|nr:hypothetical protein [Planctomycetia bacterium]